MDAELKKEQAARAKDALRRGKELSDLTIKLSESLDLPELEQGVLGKAIESIGRQINGLATQLDAAFSLILGRAKTPDTTTTCLKLLDVFDELVTDVLDSCRDNVQDERKRHAYTLPARMTFGVTAAVDAGMPHAEAVIKVLNELVTDEKERNEILHNYYARRFTDELVKRTKELTSREHLPMEAATLQAIDEIIDNNEVRDKLREKVFLLFTAQRVSSKRDLEDMLGASLPI